VLFLVHRFLSPWWRRCQVPSKRRFLQEPHGVTTQKTPFFIVTAVKTSNLRLYKVHFTESFIGKVSGKSLLVSPAWQCAGAFFGRCETFLVLPSNFSDLAPADFSIYWKLRQKGWNSKLFRRSNRRWQVEIWENSFLGAIESLYERWWCGCEEWVMSFKKSISFLYVNNIPDDSNGRNRLN
jgi:hypothetical protein